jgi:hypothetical protein
VPSILENGILSHARVAKLGLAHMSVADDEVQARRAAKRIPPAGKPLHAFVNLYFHARNGMMYRRKEQHAELCVLRVRTDVLDLPSVVVSDRNAAAGIARFDPPSVGIAALDRASVFAQSWDHADPLEKKRREQLRMAEALVPDIVPANFIVGAYVSCDQSQRRLAALAPDLATTINAHVFFR